MGDAPNNRTTTQQHTQKGNKVNIPNEYRAYAETEADAAAMVKLVEAANYPGAAIARPIPYVPGLWSVLLVPANLVGQVA